MAVAINIIAMSPDEDLVVICSAAFQSVEHAPQSQNNLCDIYLLGSAVGTRIEAVLQRGVLTLDLHRSDLNDISLGSALFDMARRGPCAILTDEADMVAVAEPKYIGMAASALGCPKEMIEPVTSGADLFDLLFGVEPPRIPSPDLAPGLKDLGFQIDPANHHRATLRLQNGTFLELDPDEHFGWQETQGVSLGLANPRFAAVMNGWTPDISGPLAELDARKARQDKAGFMLWSGDLRFGEFPATPATPVLGTYDQAMPLDALVTRLTEPEPPKALAVDVCAGALSPFVMPTEGLWVFLFLMTEAECDRFDILDSYHALKSNGAGFGTRHRLSLEIIDAYMALHHSRVDQGA